MDVPYDMLETMRAELFETKLRLESAELVINLISAEIDDDTITLDIPYMQGIIADYWEDV